MSEYVIAIAAVTATATAILTVVFRQPKTVRTKSASVLSQLLRHHPALIVLTDCEGCIKEASASFRRMFFGKSPRSESHSSTDQIIADRSKHDYCSILHYVLRERKPLFDYQVSCVAEREEVLLELTVLPVLDGTDETKTLIHYFKPASEHAAHTNADADLHDSSGIGTLAAGIAHELNTPLGSIILSADIIQDAEIAPHLLEEAAKIKHQAEHCSDVVRGVLAFARRERQDRAKLDIGELVKKVCRHIENEAKARGSSVRVETTRRPALIIGNEGQVQQVCYNLLSNALQAIEHGGEIQVSVRRDASRREIAIGIADNGRGIPRDRLDKIFDPFYTTKSVSEGTGLGLALCRKTVSEHGGRLEVRSEVGVGTAFTAYFPEAR